MADAATTLESPTTQMTQPQSASALLQAQRSFYDSGATRPFTFRRDQLRALQNAIVERERDIIDVLYQDLHKPEFEAYITELHIVHSELKDCLKNLRRWMKPKRTRSPLALQPSKSYVYPEPLGTNLIISPWNYPLNLALCPLVAAIAAGNTAILKPSELSPHTSQLVAEIVRDTFDPAHVTTMMGGPEVATELLELRWDHIFFTGSTRIGRIVAQAGAKHLSKVTLELGGKSPAIVTGRANVPIAAKRILWGKCINAGQTCIAPDYVLADAAIYDQLVAELKSNVELFYKGDPKNSPDLCRIINDRHFNRLTKLIDPTKVVVGGDVDPDSHYVSPTIMRDVTHEDPVMHEEIFGPILPVLKIQSTEEAIQTVRRYPNPLALYLFSDDATEQETIRTNLPFGGGCINNTIAHLGDSVMPFGGIGESGIGSYHGHHGFRCFSHYKGILKSQNWFDPFLKYAPYKGKLRILKWLL